MEVSGDEIANVVLENFASWEKKRKPLNGNGDSREWVPLSGIVVQPKESNSLICLAAATGMKCLPQKHIPKAQGVTLHDWHAEILAIRSFNHFILEECLALANSPCNVSEFLRRRQKVEQTESHFQPFALKDDLRIHMYCSEAPCGDASMELIMAAQEDPTPWSLPEPPSSSEHSLAPSSSLHGRGYFSNLGVTRRKPSRPDAPPTLSKSCTDKIALKQSTSLLSSLTSLLVSPENCYIHSLVLPNSQLSSVAMQRAFSPEGRLKDLAGRDWGNGYAFKPFRVLGTSKEFTYSRRVPGIKDFTPSNIASSWTPHGSETIIGGTLQGRKQFDVRGASRVCKRKMWRLAAVVALRAGLPVLGEALTAVKYSGVKSVSFLEERRKVKDDVRRVLGGWAKNDGDDDFGRD